mmetsp:Transcript_25177/g.24944  ORF Transcript_25177/g.24944 Transcript_25177/m.24944 type:complete len:84 (-) Transcript_25177:23-274(-)
MFEKQKEGNSALEHPVVIPDNLQEEFNRKSQTKSSQNNPQLKTLLEFANEQIKRLQKEIKEARNHLPKPELGEIDEATEEKED